MFYTGGRLGSISSVMSDCATPSVRHADREIGAVQRERDEKCVVHNEVISGAVVTGDEKGI